MLLVPLDGIHSFAPFLIYLISSSLLRISRIFDTNLVCESRSILVFSARVRSVAFTNSIYEVCSLHSYSINFNCSNLTELSLMSILWLLTWISVKCSSWTSVKGVELPSARLRGSMSSSTPPCLACWRNRALAPWVQCPSSPSKIGSIWYFNDFNYTLIFLEVSLTQLNYVKEWLLKVLKEVLVDDWIGL